MNERPGLAALFCAALAPLSCTPSSPPAGSDAGPARAALSLSAGALREGAPVPAPFACVDDEHLGKSPQLAWSKGPAGTVGYALTMVDPDAKGFVHWAVIDLPAETTALPEGASPGGALPPGAVELPNDFEKSGYGGPCPPPGAPHHYVIEVRALKQAVPAAHADAAFFKALDEATLASGRLTATFKR